MFESLSDRFSIGKSCHAILAYRATIPLQALSFRLFRHPPCSRGATYGPLCGSCVQVALLSSKEE
jgi:hypothetical protein